MSDRAWKVLFLPSLVMVVATIASVDTSGLMRNGPRSGHYNTEPAAQVYVQINWSSKGL
jgi:hypothetical protein